MAYPRTLTVDGQTIYETAPNCFVRADRTVGTFRAVAPPAKLDEVRWYTFEQIAERATVQKWVPNPGGGGGGSFQLAPLPVSEVVRRLRDGWRFADLIKPVGWERVVDARRNGVQFEGSTLTLPQLAARLGCSVLALEKRLFKGYPPDALLAPGRPRRLAVSAAADNVPTSPSTLRPQANMPMVTSHVPFFFRGAVDTLLGHVRAAGVNYSTVKYRLARGMSLEEAFDCKRKVRSDKGVPNPKRGAWLKQAVPAASHSAPPALALVPHAAPPAPVSQDA